MPLPPPECRSSIGMPLPPIIVASPVEPDLPALPSDVGLRNRRFEGGGGGGGPRSPEDKSASQEVKL